MPSYSNKKLRLHESLETYLEKIGKGEYQFHQFQGGCAVTEVHDYPQERVLTVHFLTGSGFGGWRDAAQAHLEAFGREWDCTAIEALCRVGLGRKIAPLGYKQTRILMRKEL